MTAIQNGSPVHVMFNVRDSVFFYDSLWWKVGDGATKPITANIIVPGKAVPPCQAEVRNLK